MQLLSHNRCICRVQRFRFHSSIVSLPRHLSGIVYVSGEPLIAHPNDAASLAVENLLQRENRRLTIYEALERPARTRSATVALSIISDLAALKAKVANTSLHLPLISGGLSGLEAVEFAKPPDGDTSESDDYELPPHLQPVPKDDGIASPPKGETPPFSDDSGFSADAVDFKNTHWYYLDDGQESERYSDEAENAWIKADREECSKGARLRFYEVFENVKNESISAVCEEYQTPIPDHYDPSPMRSSSAICPILLIYQIPHQAVKSLDDMTNNVKSKTEQEFLEMYQRYAYLTSNGSYHRISAFRQKDPIYPRWLIMQEFLSDVRFNDSVAVKKKEAEYWWRKHGWEGVLVDFFRIKGDNEEK